MSREQLSAIYLEFLNNFLTVARFAEVYGYHEDEARALLDVARAVLNASHPEA